MHRIRALTTIVKRSLSRVRTKAEQLIPAFSMKLSGSPSRALELTLTPAPFKIRLVSAARFAAVTRMLTRQRHVIALEFAVHGRPVWLGDAPLAPPDAGTGGRAGDQPSPSSVSVISSDNGQVRPEASNRRIVNRTVDGAAPSAAQSHGSTSAPQTALSCHAACRRGSGRSRRGHWATSDSPALTPKPVSRASRPRIAQSPSRAGQHRVQRHRQLWP
jgi:hypothetical protein